VSRRGWTLVGVFVVLALMVGAYFWLSRPKPAAAPAAALPVLSKGDKDKIVKVVLGDRPEGTLVLIRNGDKWVTDPPVNAVLEPTSVDNLLYAFSSLNAERVIEEKPANLGQYGLAPPRAAATGTWLDGTTRTLLLGDRAPSGSSYYIQVKGDPRVYTVQSYTGQNLHWTLKDIRSRTITPPINYDEVEYVKIVERDGTVLEAKKKTDAETKTFQLGFGQYLLTRPYPTPRGLDSQKQDTLIKGAQSVSISDFAEEPLKGMEAYGLSNPKAEAVVRDKSNTIDYLFGDQKGTQTWFAVRGQPGVYLVDTSSLDFLKTKPFDVIDKFVFIPNIDDMDRMDITTGGTAHTLIITRTSTKAAKAGDPDVVTSAYTADGKTVEAESFKKCYQSLIGLQVEGETSRKVGGTPDLSMVFALNKGDVRKVRVDYTPYDRDFDAIFVNGVGGFALTKGQLTDMLGKLKLLVTGQKVTD
jgi:hypothetical protein